MINASALDDILEALAGGQRTPDIERIINFHLALRALHDGLSLAEIVQHTAGQLEKHMIHHILMSTQNNKSEAARLLKIDYKTLYRKMHKHFGISRRTRLHES